ncbi:MAG: hypothetical protein ACHQ1H_06950 [Nitrososphaerales archaeon]
MLARLYYVSDLLESGDFLYDLYFGENRLIAVRSARKSLCRVAIGMAGVTISDKPLTMRQLTAVDSKNIFSIPYADLTSLKIERDSKSQMVLQLVFKKRRSMIFVLDANQFASIILELSKIREIQKILSVNLA